MRHEEKIAIAAFIIFIVVSLVVSVGTVWVLNTNREDYTKFWNPQIGQFVEDTWSGDNITIHRYEILSINATEVMYKFTQRDSTGEHGSFIASAPRDTTFPNFCDVTYPYEEGITEIGKERLSTLWGERTCIHFVKTYSPNLIQEFWVHNGVMLYQIWKGGGGYMELTWTLTATNIPEVTHH